MSLLNSIKLRISHAVGRILRESGLGRIKYLKIKNKFLLKALDR